MPEPDPNLIIELPGAYNDWAVGTDELNGGGVNWWLDTLGVIDSSAVYVPLIPPADFFVDIDIFIPKENRTVVLRKEPREICVAEVVI